MALTEPFDRYTERYEHWFERHAQAYDWELQAVRDVLPAHLAGLEVGVGSGRFAAPLGFSIGVDPSAPMLALAKQRGIHAVRGVAEALPFSASSFDAALLVTTICFVDDAARMHAEIRRVLRRQGALVIGFVDAASDLGQQYRERQADNPFYRDARFFSADEVAALLEEAGFRIERWRQTLFAETDADQQPRPGHGQGGFVAVVARAP